MSGPNAWHWGHTFALDSSVASDRASAISFLFGSNVSNHKVLGKIRELLRDSDASVRTEATQFIACQCKPEDRERLLSLIGDTCPQVCAYAILGLKRIDPEILKQASFKSRFKNETDAFVLNCLS